MILNHMVQYLATKAGVMQGEVERTVRHGPLLPQNEIIPLDPAVRRGGDRTHSSSGIRFGEPYSGQQNNLAANMSLSEQREGRSNAI
jgi:hypothetical protein